MKTSHILLFIAACCISVQAFATEKLSVQELLNKYAENQDKMKSFIARTESVWMPSPESTTDQQQQNRSKSIVEFRYEDTGKDFKAYFCRTPLKLESNGTWVEENASQSTKILWRDKCYYQYFKASRLEYCKLYVTADPKHVGKVEFEIAYDGVGPFLGFLCGDRERIDSILRRSESLSVRPDLDQIGSVKCYVVDAVSRHGTYTIWFDPEHGYCIAKAIVRKGPEDLRWGRPLSSYTYSSDNSTEMMQNVRFERVNGIWFPVEYEWLSTIEFKDRTLSGRTQYNVTYLDVNPDHNDLGSFSFDGLAIQEGTRTIIGDAHGEVSRTDSTWQKSKKFVVDEWDGRIKYVPEDWSIRAGVSKTLPEFECIDLDITAEDIRDKTILLCFFNMNQRPSRNCLLQLSKKAKELKVKDIAIVGVQVSNIDENDLRKWTKENNIPFPIGMIRGEEEKTRFAWGIRSLPWLILADKKHIIRAEGFGIEVLDEELKKTEATPAKQAVPTNNPDPPKSFLNVEEILVAWERTYVSIRTMRVSYSYRVVDYKPPNNDPNWPAPVMSERAERVEDGKRYHMRYSNAEDGFDRPEKLTEYAFDGKITREYFGSTNSGTIKLGLTGSFAEQMNRFKDFTLTKLQVVPDYFKKKYPNGVTMFDELFGLIKSTKNIWPYLETIAGEPCHVVEVTYIGGQQSEPEKDIFWIAHDKGMCLMKYQKYENNKMTRETEVEQIAMADMDGTSIWYPVKIRRHEENEDIGNITEELIVKQFVPNVKVDENTFRFDFPPGTDVYDIASRKSYTWQKGMKFIVDEWNNSICYVPEDWSILVGVGKPLPEFERIGPDITAEDTKGKTILICFFDMNQRPSRNCLLQLSKRAQELKVKDIAIVGVQVSNIDENDLRKWTKENNIPFPIGMIRGEEEKTRFTWGVRSLPWLILADKKHTVRTEGFIINELDLLIGEIEHVQEKSLLKGAVCESAEKSK